ncbi:hypothetical protein EPO17_02570 [Patescibacteria group bacterium]|nr:MAG: hypothetical protein EPO17_02570 [Patescibacteria group bacterium]
MIDILIQLGLSRTESLVYKTLLDVGPCFVAPLVSATRKHRQIVYNALETLEERKLITVTQKNGKHLFAVGDPNRFLLDLKQKEVLATQVISEVSRSLHDEREQVDVFHGHAPAVSDFRMRARQAGEYIVVRGESKGWFHYSRPFFKEHVEELRKIKHAGIDIMIMFFEYERRNARELVGSYLKQPYSCKIAHDQYRIPYSFWLAGDHVYVLTPAVDPRVVHIQSKVFAEHHREYFWNNWKRAQFLD